MSKLSVQLDFACARWKKAFTRMPSKIEKAAILAFTKAKKPRAFKDRKFELAIILSNDSTIRKLNREYRRQDKPTNVLSFPQMQMEGLRKKDLDIFPVRTAIPLGDVVLASGTVKREARTEKKDLENHAIHLVVHGVLHLLGYDHMKAKDAKIMEKLECDILKDLGYPDPYHDAHSKSR